MNTLNSNASSLTSITTLNRSQESLGRSLARLSSGSRITSPADDSTALAKAGKMDNQQRRLTAAATNVQNAVSLVQTTDSFLSGMTRIVSRLSELTSLAKDVTANPADVALYDKEFQSLQSQLRGTIGGSAAEIGGNAGPVAPLATFNGRELFAANPPGTTITVGSESTQTVKLTETNLRQGALLSVIAQDGDGAFTLGLADAGPVLTNALTQLAESRATIGGTLSRLEMSASSLSIEQQNLESAISRISDVDVAAESTQLAKYNILIESSSAMLAQSNQDSSSVLKLLQS